MLRGRLLQLRSLKNLYAFVASFGASKVLSKLLVFLLFFVSAKTPERYGMLAVLIAVEHIACTLLDLGHKRVIFRFYGEDVSDNNRFLSSTLTVWILMTAVILLLFAGAIAAFGIKSFF